ncbi:hypothetical protein C8F04DRAFT_1189979 [Mycena alexandri]|uniref:Uncharacterized protein n=1 Tax=Mycena alexandri TaxID=1745969 RepID=A0AAD6SGD2_9AGAR|nr:hypothetical protein C8F04DRAFT_1189979 [Mycena alexandri]
MSRKRKSQPEDEYSTEAPRVLSAAEKAVKAERNRKASAAYYARWATILSDAQPVFITHDSHPEVREKRRIQMAAKRAEIKAKRRRKDPPTGHTRLLPRPVSPPSPLSPSPVITPAPSPAAECPRSNVCWEFSNSESSDDDLPIYSLRQLVSWKPQPIDDAPAETNHHSSGLGIGMGTANSRTSEDERLATLILAEMAEARAAEASAVENTVPVRSPAKARADSLIPGLGDIPRTRVETLQAFVAELNSGPLSGPTPAKASAWDRRRSRYAPPELQTMHPERWRAMDPYPVVFSSWNDDTHDEYQAAARDLSMPESGLRLSDSLGNLPENFYALYWRNRQHQQKMHKPVLRAVYRGTWVDKPVLCAVYRVLWDFWVDKPVLCAVYRVLGDFWVDKPVLCAVYRVLGDFWVDKPVLRAVYGVLGDFWVDKPVLRAVYRVLGDFWVDKPVLCAVYRVLGDFCVDKPVLRAVYRVLHELMVDK